MEATLSLLSFWDVNINPEDTYLYAKGKIGRKSHTFIVNERTNAIHPISVKDGVAPSSVFRMKCFGIAVFGNFVHLVGTMAYNALKIPVDVIRILITGVANFMRDFSELGTWHNLTKNWNDATLELVTSVSDDIWNIIRSPYYALGIEIAALAGIFNPLGVGLAGVSQIEFNWNHQRSRETEFRVVGFHNMTAETTFYMAFCFQPIESHNVRLEPERYTHISDVTNKRIKEFYSFCDKIFPMCPCERVPLSI